jgi:hypothetical protein
MLRILGLAVAVALTLAGAQSEPSAEEAYTAGVRAAVDERTFGRLFDQVVNYDRTTCYAPHLLCGPDSSTAVGFEWLEAERRFVGEARRSADRLEDLRPPSDFANLHERWVAAVRSCGDRLHRLEPTLQLIDNIDVVDAFEKGVARTADEWCLDPVADFMPHLREARWATSLCVDLVCFLEEFEQHPIEVFRLLEARQVPRALEDH